MIITKETLLLQKRAGIISESQYKEKLKEIKEDSLANLEILLMDYYYDEQIYSENESDESLDNIVEWALDTYEEDDPLRISLENNKKLFDSLLKNNIDNEINVGNFSVIPFIENNKIFIKFKRNSEKANTPSSSTQKEYTPVYNMGGTPDKLKVDYFDKGTYKKVYLYIKPYVLAQGEVELEDELIISISNPHLKLIEPLLEERNISYTKQVGPSFSNIRIEKKYLDINKLDPSKAGLLMDSVATGKYFELYKQIINKTENKQAYLDALNDKILKDTGYKPLPSLNS